jgi:hypothetical protein
LGSEIQEADVVKLDSLLGGGAGLPMLTAADAATEADRHGFKLQNRRLDGPDDSFGGPVRKHPAP